MILEALGDHLNGQLSLTQGTNLFLAKMPDSPDLCVTLYEYEGSFPTEHFGGNPYDVDQPRIQVVCRAARDDYPTARDKVHAIRGLLADLTDITISSTKILRVASLGAYVPLGLDEKDRPRIAANFQCYVER